MWQLNMFSIIFNGLAGFLFIQGDAIDKGGGEGETKAPPFSGGFKLIVGVAAGAVGILKLFAPFRYPDSGIHGAPILGDLIPAAAGIAAGFMLVYGFYREQRSGAYADGKLDRAWDELSRIKRLLGIACVAAAALHLIFARFVFL